MEIVLFAGLAAGASQERKIDDARYEGKKEGYVDASEEYEKKCADRQNHF